MVRRLGDADPTTVNYKDVKGHIDDISNPHDTKLENLGDVIIGSPINDGDVLTYNNTLESWEPGSASSGSGDMTKDVYDSNDDGIVTAADKVTNNSSDLNVYGTTSNY